MGSIVHKVVGGHTYYYLREMARVDGKPKMVSQRYLGKAADIEAAIDGAMAVPERTRHLAFGDVAAEGEDCVQAAMKLATRLADMPTRALVATRQLLRAAASNDLDQQLDLERDTQSALGKTHDYLEGVMAFREKRPAKFKGE